MKKNLVSLLSLMIISIIAFQSCKNDKSTVTDKQYATQFRLKIPDTTDSGLKPLLNKILQGINNGELRVFENDSLNVQISTETWKTIRHITEYIETGDSINGFKDSIVDRELSPTDISGLTLYQSASVGNNFSSFCFKLHSISLNRSHNLGQINIKNNPFCWIKTEDLYNYLGKEQIKQFNEMLSGLIRDELSPGARDGQNLRYLTDLSDFIGKFTLKDYYKKMYIKASNDELTVYPNDSLITAYTLLEIDSLGSYEEVIQYAPDPEYPNFLVDSVIKNFFRPEDITAFRLSAELDFENGLDYTITPNALAPTFTFKTGQSNVYISGVPLFWVNLDDLSNAFTAFEEKNVRKSLFQECLQKHGYLPYLD